MDASTHVLVLIHLRPKGAGAHPGLRWGAQRVHSRQARPRTVGVSCSTAAKGPTQDSNPCTVT